jgi:hypothetical protein
VDQASVSELVGLSVVMVGHALAMELAVAVKPSA